MPEREDLFCADCGHEHTAGVGTRCLVINCDCPPEREEVKPVTDQQVADLKRHFPASRRFAAAWPVVSVLIARIEQDAATVEQLTKEREEARAEVVSFQRKYTTAMAEVARLRKRYGPDCPACGLFLREHRLVVPFSDQGVERYIGPRGRSCITVDDLCAKYPAIAREMGVTNE